MSTLDTYHPHHCGNFTYLFEVDDEELGYIYLVSTNEDKSALHKLWDILDSIEVKQNQLLISKRRGTENES